MRRVVWLCLLPLAVSGCATMEWVHPDRSGRDFYVDKLECQGVANKLAWERYPRVESVTIQSTNIDTTVQVGENATGKSRTRPYHPVNVLPVDPYSSSRDNFRNECLSDCLHSKGWILQRAEK